MAEPLQTERYASSSVDAESLWALVGDPVRLTEWTDVEDVAAPTALEEGTQVLVCTRGAWSTWRLITVGTHGWEASASLGMGELALGCRVADEGTRTRLVLVASLEPSGSRLRAHLWTVPRLGARLERWAETGARLARR